VRVAAPAAARPSPDPEPDPERAGPGGPDGRRLGHGASLLVVLAAFALAQLPLVVAAARVGPDDMRGGEVGDPTFFDADSYARWDAYHYMDLARSGATLDRCAETDGWPPGSWCGNAGWFPAYPLAVRALASPWDEGHAEVVAGVALSRACQLVSLALLWWCGLRRRVDARHLAALALGALAAGLVYQVAVYPISLATAASFGALVLLARRRPLAAGCVAGAAVAAHTTGPVVVAAGVAALVVGAVLDRPVAWRRVARDLVLFVGPCLAWWAAALAWFDRSTGQWDAPYLVQDKYAHHPRAFVAVWVDRVSGLVHPPENPYEPPSRWPGAQTLLATATVAAGVVAALRRGWARLDALDRVLVPAMVVTWLAPLSLDGNFTSQHRLEALLLPAAALARHLPAWLTGALAVVGAVVGTAMATLFFAGTLG
jgi:hypothetical protein